MAFGTGTIWEVNSSGDDTNFGGGFDPGATFAADLAATSGTGTAPVVTSASYTFVAGDVGAYLFVKSGTNWRPGWYLIASVSAGAATLTATIGSVVLYNSTSSLPATQFNITAGCATTASPTSGTWGIDYSRSTTARITFTDLVIDGTTNTKFTSAANPVGVNFIGNIISVTSGTGFTVQRVLVSSVVTTTATCDKSLGTLSSTGGNGRLGGALASVGKAGSVSQAGNVTYVVGNHTFSLSNSSNVAGGKWAAGGSVCGYTTNRVLYNLDSNLPVFQSSANSMTLFNSGGNSIFSSLVAVNGNSNTSITAFTDSGNNGAWFFNLKASAVSIAVNPFSNQVVEWCAAISCTSVNPFQSGGSSNRYIDCVISGGGGFLGNGISSSCTRCIVAGNTLASPDFSTFGFLEHCISYAHNVTQAAISNCNWMRNCIISTQAGAGNFGLINTQAGTNLHMYALNCAFYNNLADSGQINGQQIVGKISLTADPFTNAAGGDFSLNNNAGGGAACKAMGFPTTFLGISTSQFLDIGAAQGTSVASGAATRARVFAGM